MLIVDLKTDMIECCPAFYHFMMDTFAEDELVREDLFMLSNDIFPPPRLANDKDHMEDVIDSTEEQDMVVDRGDVKDQQQGRRWKEARRQQEEEEEEEEDSLGSHSSVGLSGSADSGSENSMDGKSTFSGTPQSTTDASSASSSACSADADVFDAKLIHHVHMLSVSCEHLTNFSLEETMRLAKAAYDEYIEDVALFGKSSHTAETQEETDIVPGFNTSMNYIAEQMI